MEKNNRSKKTTLCRTWNQRVDKLCLSLTAKRLLKLLVSYHVYAGAVFPGQKSLAAKLGLSRRTIIRVLNDLEAHGHITRLPQKSCFRTRIYVVHLGSFSLPFKGLEDIDPPPMSPCMTHNVNRHKKTLNQNKTAFSKKSPALPSTHNVIPWALSETNKNLAETMIQILDQETQGTLKPDPNYAAYTLRKLYHHLQTHCGGHITQWRAFCQRVATSPYLMGHNTSFTPHLLWLIKPETLHKIRIGAFHRSVIVSQSFIHTTVLHDLEDWLTRDRQKQAQTLSVESHQQLQRQFEALLACENSWRSHAFKASGWDSPDVRTAFLDFKINAVCGPFQADLSRLIASKKGYGDAVRKSF